MVLVNTQQDARNCSVVELIPKMKMTNGREFGRRKRRRGGEDRRGSGREQISTW
jgi:hypothetical protein